MASEVAVAVDEDAAMWAVEVAVAVDEDAAMWSWRWRWPKTRWRVDDSSEELVELELMVMMVGPVMGDLGESASGGDGGRFRGRFLG